MMIDRRWTLIALATAFVTLGGTVHAQEAQTGSTQPAAEKPVHTKAEATAALADKKTEIKELKTQATDITKSIALILQDSDWADKKEAVKTMQELVQQMTKVQERLMKIDEEIEEIKGWIEGQNENLPILANDVADLKRTKFSTYVQFQYQDTDRNGTTLGAVPYDAFRLRRVRLGMTQTIDPRTKLKVSYDLATGTNQLGAQLKDAFLTYVIQPNEVSGDTEVVMGQQPLPLGYELERSSSDREFPERAQYNQVMFNGERSRGVQLRHPIAPNVTAHFGAFDALSVNDPEQANLAPGTGNRLAATGGLRYSTTNADFGISALFSERAKYNSGTVGVDSPRIHRQFIYLDGHYVGLFDPKLFLRGELMFGKDRVPNATAAASRIQTDMLGYQIHLGYNINARNQINARYEYFDRDTNVDDNVFSAYELAYIYYINPGAKLVFAHQVTEDETRVSPLNDNYHGTTLRVQFKF